VANGVLLCVSFFLARILVLPVYYYKLAAGFQARAYGKGWLGTA
jgi:hypothetical protein